MPHDTDQLDVHRQPFTKVNEPLNLQAKGANSNGASGMRGDTSGRWQGRTLTLVASIAALAWASAAGAQDALEVAPDIYRKLAENSHMRVLEATVKPGAKVALHSHPEHLLYFLSDGTLVMKIKGKTPYEMTFKGGDTFLLPAQMRATENNGGKTVRMLVVELKTGARKPRRSSQRQ